MPDETYTPYLLTVEEAELLAFMRNQRSKRGSSSPSGAAGSTPVIQFAVPPELAGDITLIKQRLSLMSDTFDTTMAGTTADLAKLTTVTASVMSFISGLSAQLKDAESHSVAAGATPAQTAALRAVREGMVANINNLVAAITTNTVAADEPAPAPTTTEAGAAPTTFTVTTSKEPDQPASPEQDASPEQQAT